MTELELKELLASFESEHVERTRAFDKADKMGEAICAFANDISGSGKSGYLLLGVDDNGKIAGRRIDDEKWASLGGLKTDGNILPPPAMSMEKFSLPEGDVIVIQVFPSSYPPIRYKGDVWVRNGPRKCKATEEDIHILNERRTRFGMRNEELPCERARLTDLDIDLFRGFYLPKAINAQAIEADDRTVEEQLLALGFYSSERACPTNLGVLLFARHPERFIPSAYIQYVKFAGLDNAGDVLQENVFKGPLVRVVQDLDVFIKTGPAAQRPVLVTVLREEPEARYPSWALRELVLNAIIHRDYFLGNAPIKFYEYKKNRIEISNPGGLFGRAKPDNFPFVNDYRNPLLAEAMKVLGLVNKFNRGIAKVNRELVANGNPAAQFDVNKLTEFRVTIVAKPESGPINSGSGPIKPESGQTKRIIAQTYDTESQDEAVVAIIGANPGIKREKIFLQVQTSLKSVQRTLNRLSANKKIEYRGSKRTGGWFVKT